MTSGMSSRALAVPVRGMTATTGSTSRTPMAVASDRTFFRASEIQSRSWAYAGRSSPEFLQTVFRTGHRRRRMIGA